MKRDIDLVRNILLALEQHEHGRAPPALEIQGYSEEQIGFHVHLMGEVGLLEVADTTNTGSASPEAIAVRITWDGYDFLEVARKPSIWEAAKSKIREEGAGMSLEVLKLLLVALSKKALGIE